MKQRFITQDLLRLFNPQGKWSGFVDLLIVKDELSSLEFEIRCGGRAMPQNKYVTGYMLPLVPMKKEIRLKELDGHKSGCSELNYNKNKELVEKYAKRFQSAFDRKIAYIDLGLTFKIDTTNISELCEGYVPVQVIGKSLSGCIFESLTSAIIVEGNCI